MALSFTTSAYPTSTLKFAGLPSATVFPGATAVSVRSKSRAEAVSLHCEEQIFVPEVQRFTHQRQLLSFFCSFFLFQNFGGNLMTIA